MDLFPEDALFQDFTTPAQSTASPSQATPSVSPGESAHKSTLGKATNFDPYQTFVNATQQNPDAPSLVGPRGRFTRAQSLAWVQRCTQALTNLGLRAGQRLALICPNSEYHLILWVACNRLDAVFVPLNPRQSTAELTKILVDCTPHIAIFADEILTDFTASNPTNTADNSPIRLSLSEFHQAQATALALNHLEPTPKATGKNQLSALIYTSGTSGQPRGICHTRASMWWAWQNYRAVFGYTDDDVALAMAPLSHIGGFNGTTNDIFIHGGKVVIVPHFRPREVLNLIQKEHATIGFGVPTMYVALAREMARTHTRLRSFVRPLIGGAPLPAALAQDLEQAGLVPFHVWGMTETGGAGTCLPPPLSLARPHSVGRAFPLGRVLLIGEDGAEITAAGQVGRVIISGPQVVTQAWPDSTLPTVTRPEGEYLDTGDLGQWLDVPGGDRELQLCGRATETIITGGEKVHPVEVEQVLGLLVAKEKLEIDSNLEETNTPIPSEPTDRTDDQGQTPDTTSPSSTKPTDRSDPVEPPSAKPLLCEIGDFAIVGVPDDYWGQRVCLAITGRADLDLVRGELAKHLAGYKLPKQLVVLPELPRNGNGKLDRTALAQKICT